MDDRVGLLLRRVDVWWWRVRVRAVRAGVGRPADARHVFAAGPSPLRVLVVGSGPVAGWGVASHDLALPGTLARALATSTGRGVAVDVIPDAAAGVRQLNLLLKRAPIAPLDVLVLSGAVADTLRLAAPARWAIRLRRLLVRAHSRGPSTVAWLAAQPIRSIRPYDNRHGQIAQDHADILNARAEQICHDNGSIFVPLSAPPGTDTDRHRSPGDYMFWARQIADALLPTLEDARTAVTIQAAARVAAIKRLKLSQHEKDPRLDALVAAAKRAIGADMAMITVLDDHYEWPLVSTAAVLEQIPIEQSACIHTIQTVDGLIIADAAKDHRFARNTFVTGSARLRYYAGYPIEAPDGTRIGALCALSRTPRDGSTNTADLDALRELALLTQRELWNYTDE